MLALPPRTVRPGLTSIPALTRTDHVAWQSPPPFLPFCLLCLLLPRAPWLGAGHGVWEVGGEQRGKMGIQLKGKKEAMPPEQERRGGGKARGLSMAGRGGSWAPFPSPCVPWGPFPSRVPAGWTRLVADEDFPFGVCPFLVSPSPPNPYLLVSTSTPFPALDTPPFSVPFLVSPYCLSPLCHPCPSPPPRPPADHLQQPGCHQDRGPGSGPPLPGPGVRPLLQWAQGAGAGRRERP